MSKKRLSAHTLTLIALLVTTACLTSIVLNDIAVAASDSQGQIYLYGERHGVDKM